MSKCRCTIKKWAATKWLPQSPNNFSIRIRFAPCCIKWTGWTVDGHTHTHTQECKSAGHRINNSSFVLTHWHRTCNTPSASISSASSKRCRSTLINENCVFIRCWRCEMNGRHHEFYPRTRFVSSFAGVDTAATQPLCHVFHCHHSTFVVFYLAIILKERIKNYD